MKLVGTSRTLCTLFTYVDKRICSRQVWNLRIQRQAYSTLKMRLVKQDKYGGPETLYIADQEHMPEPGHKQLLVEVHGTAVNRADLLMSKGLYPGQDKNAPPTTIGLEMSGVVKSAGSGCSAWKTGDQVMGLMPGGAYAEYVVINEDHVMPVPSSVSLSQAGGIPEAWLTAYQLLHFVGHVKPEDYVLIHGGGSGVGTAAVQLVRLAGGVPLVTAGSQRKIDAAVKLGAKAGFNYKEGEFAEGVMKETEGLGANLILDCVGGSFWQQNLTCLGKEGTWVNYGLLGGGKIDGNLLGGLLRKRGTLTTSTLKTRSDEYKAQLSAAFAKNALPYFSKPLTIGGGEVQLKMVVDIEFPFTSVGEAHEYVSQNKNIGKVLIKVR